MHDLLRALGSLGIAELDRGLVDGHDLVEIIGYVFHAVGAERVLRADGPAGRRQILRGIALIGRVEDDRAGASALIGHVQDRRPERVVAVHGELTAGKALLLLGGDIVMDGDIFLVKHRAGAQRSRHRQHQQQAYQFLFHVQRTSEMFSKPFPKTFFALVTMKKAFSSWLLTRRLSWPICWRLMTHISTSRCAPE